MINVQNVKLGFYCVFGLLIAFFLVFTQFEKYPDDGEETV